MKKLLFVLIVFFTIYSCSNGRNGDTELMDLIPDNSSVVLKIKELESFKSDLKNNDLFEAVSSTKRSKDLLKQLEFLDHLRTDSQILVCFENIDDKIEYTIITKYYDSLITILESDSTKIYSKILDSIYIGSSSKFILDNIKLNKKSKLKTLFRASSSASSFSVYLNEQNSNIVGKSIFNENMRSFSSKISFDVEIFSDQITINGIAKANDTVSQLLKLFKNTIAQENKIQNIVPSNSDGFLSFTYNDFEILNKNLFDYNKKTQDSIANNGLFQTVNEVGTIYFENDTIVALKSIDVTATIEALQEYSNVVSNYRNLDVFEFTQPSLFKVVFTPLIESENISNYIIVDDFFVFASSESRLHDVITNFQNGTTLATQNAYTNSKALLSDEASILVVGNPSKLKAILASIVNENLDNLKLNDYKVSAFQFVQDDEFVHINGVIRKNKSRAQQNSISEEFNFVLDADIVMAPHFVTNYRTKQKEVVVQDANNYLYLISNTGKILWKKELHGLILGQIEQIDMYKNGRLQLAFATSNRVYVLDRNGNDVAPFPAKFNDQITQPLSVFDYDKNKNYRLLVTQGKNVLMYDAKAKLVKGFTFKSATNTINYQPQHFRIGSKDYITVKTENKLHILDRVGNTRITPKTSSTFSNQAVYIYNNKFTTTSKNGELITIDTNEKTAIQNLGLSELHGLVATSKTMVTLSDNKFVINKKSLELDFGNYTAPKIFYINDKIYVAITDLQTQKIYLFDSQAKLNNNFPVYGNSSIDLANLDNDNKLEIVVTGESNSIIVYKIN